MIFICTKRDWWADTIAQKGKGFRCHGCDLRQNIDNDTHSCKHRKSCSSKSIDSTCDGCLLIFYCCTKIK